MRFWMAKDVRSGSDFDSVLVNQPAGLGDTAPIQIGSVAASQVNEPELVFVLGMNHGVPAGDPFVDQNQVIALRPADVAGPLDRDASACGVFQPGDGLDCYIHEDLRIAQLQAQMQQGNIRWPRGRREAENRCRKTGCFECGEFLKNEQRQPFRQTARR